jgi:hypothetical protein
MSTPWALDINWGKKCIRTLAIHVNYRSYRLQVPKYECGKCSREGKEGMFGLCNKVLEIDVTYLITMVRPINCYCSHSGSLLLLLVVT